MDTVKHYDKLIDENNDPFFDPPVLKAYMDKWDGQCFIDEMRLSSEKIVLEIGVGTGRLAVRVAPLCKKLLGIDISPKTLERAKSNLKSNKNISLICDDFLKYDFSYRFDVIYSSLTSMHFENKQNFISKASLLLNKDGRFVLSTDKNQDNYIDMGGYKLKIYPDSPTHISHCIANSKLCLERQLETEFAYIFVCVK